MRPLYFWIKLFFLMEYDVFLNNLVLLFYAVHNLLFFFNLFLSVLIAIKNKHQTDSKTINIYEKENFVFN